MGHQILSISSPYLQSAPDITGLEEFITLLDGTGSELSTLVPQATELERKIALLPTDALHSSIAPDVIRLQELAPMIPAGLQIAPALPGLLGYTEPKSYLILVQNNHELRATGGFLTAAGLMTIDKGNIIDLDFVDSYKLSSKTGIYPNAL